MTLIEQEVNYNFKTNKNTMITPVTREYENKSKEEGGWMEEATMRRYLVPANKDECS